MTKKGNGRFLWLVVISIVIVLVAGACISGTQKSGLTIDEFKIEPNEIKQGGVINIEIDVVNHEDRILPANTMGVFVCRVVWVTADEKWHSVEEDEYWKDLPKSKWIDKEIGADVPYPIPFTAISENTIPRGAYKFKACIFNETNKCVDYSPIRTVTVTY